MCWVSAFFDTQEKNRHFCSLVTSVTYVTRLNGYGGSLGDASRQIENDGAKPSIGHKKNRKNPTITFGVTTAAAALL